MQRAVIGTAGHIDHGKTTLLKALTGIDCDRWDEEKARGITIDLGFAHLEDESGPEPLQIGFVDVPGHERFLHNALAGMGGLRMMLLVVAADEGVKPQTREHLAICSLLGIPNGLVALTKRDLVDEELAELAQLEVEELLEATPFAGAPVMAVSSATGEGIAELRAALVERAREIAVDADPKQPARLPVDRAFQLRGLGAVVTGTLSSGRLETGQTLTVLPTGESARIRSLQIHGQTRGEALAGERTAVQLTGVDLATVERGVQLTTAGHFAPTRSLCARFTLLADAPEALTTFVPIRFHLFSSEVIGKLRPLQGVLEPGETGLVEIRLAAPVTAVRSDRFIIRRPSPASTLGGCEILDSAWRRRRCKSLSAALAAITKEDQALQLWVRESNERGATASEIAPRLGCLPKDVQADLDRLVGEAKLLRVESGRGRRWISPTATTRVMERAKKVLKAYFKDNRLARGMPKAQLVERILPRRATDLADTYLTWMQAEKILVRADDLVHPPGHSVELTDDESTLAARLLREIEGEGLTPPSPQDFSIRLGAKQVILEGVMKYLLEQGKLVRLPSGLILAQVAVEKLKQQMEGGGDQWRQFSVAQFKDHFGLSRKWAIPMLEHLDSVGFTRRVGDQRQIVGKS